MSDPFKDFQVKHLFLLVGENPLPNYVAARKLLQEGGKVYLVYTNQTKPQKNSLVRGLHAVGIRHEPVDLGNHKADAREIYTRVHDKAKLLTDGRMGLNYTGGTNTMAVHAYRALFTLKQHDVFYSYLDSLTLEMYIDRGENESFHRKFELEVSLINLFELHDLTWFQLPLDEPKLPEAAAKFVEIYQDETIAKTWRSWCHGDPNRNHGELKKAKAPGTDKWLEEEKLSNLSPLSLAGVNLEIVNVLRQYLVASNTQLKIQNTRSKDFDNLQQLCAWLGGVWLEHYVLQQIKNISVKSKIHESKMSFQIKRSQTWKGDRFEFDVAFMRSYQLFALSCTTSADPKTCKLKLFEAYTRARQLGGDESRVALVCCCDDAPKYSTSVSSYLKDQLEGAWKNHKVAVFIRKDLTNLGSKIADWIEKNNPNTEAQ